MTMLEAIKAIRDEWRGYGFHENVCDRDMDEAIAAAESVAAAQDALIESMNKMVADDDADYQRAWEAWHNTHRPIDEYYEGENMNLAHDGEKILDAYFKKVE